MDNGTTGAVIGQFDRISTIPEGWGHNRHYLPDILGRAGRRRRAAVDLGCGAGELTRALALRCGSVTGVDASGGMIAEARRQDWGLGVTYVNGDAEAFLRGRAGQFDLIVSVSAFHHMDEGRMLGLCREALAPGGLLLVLDLYKEETLGDYAASAAAAALSPLVRLARSGSLRPREAERAAWEEHAGADSYLTLRELRALARRELGDFGLERKLFWRYLLSYEKPR